MERTASSLTIIAVDSSATPTEHAIDLARTRNLPLWCDDSAARQSARGQRITTFSTADLITQLQATGELDDRSPWLALAEEYVVDLPLSGSEVAELADASKWDVGPAHTAISRPGWWLTISDRWPEDWYEIATAAATVSEKALLSITKAALVGALYHVGAAYAGARYQRIIVLALTACHDRELEISDLLERVAEGANPSILPKPEYVLSALAEELGRRGVQDPLVAAMAMLPGVALP